MSFNYVVYLQDIAEELVEYEYDLNYVRYKVANSEISLTNKVKNRT